MENETKLCTNCKREIGTGNFVMHEMHCRRHIVLCDHCGEPIHRSEVEVHFNELHAKIPCEKCKKLVSRQDMAKHLADECMKKLMRCEFCEISLPKNELDNHLDYCGSRTECCPICKQYIMQKDKLQHEISRCAFPEVVPQPATADAFSMGDLQQFMANAVVLNRGTTNNAFKNGNIRTHRKSDLNAQMAKNLLIPESTNVDANLHSADADFDSLLALQLAHEDWLEDRQTENAADNWNYFPQYLEESSPVLNDFNSFIDVNTDQWSFLAPLRKPEPAAFNSRNLQEDAIDENMRIPCEFCDEDVPVNFYISHMETCPLALQRRETDLNNEHVPVLHNTSKTAIPVINNLRPKSPPPPTYISLSDDDDVDDDDGVMLPCEFCQEIFPSHLIIQHQSVCQNDGVLTPRAGTPTRIESNIKIQLPASQASFKSAARSPQKSRSEVDNADSGSFSREDLSNKRVPKINESSSNKYSAAYNRFDEALSRPPRRSTRQNSISSDEASELTTESKSIQRTRARLNKFMQEDTSPEKESTENHRRELGVMRNHNTNKSDLKEKKVKVDSRTVARQLEESRRKPVQGSTGRAPLPQNAPSQSRNTQTPTTRNRQRADYVFSPELRLKPNNSPPPKKR